MVVHTSVFSFSLCISASKLFSFSKKR